jgi:hypothetical protein
MTTGSTRSASADDVKTGKVTLNRSQDMNFWKQASANELRNAILQRTRALRGSDRYNRKDLGVKTKEQLLNIIRDMILDGNW